MHKLGRESTIRTGLYLSLNYTNVNYMRMFRDEHGKSFKLGQLQAKEESESLKKVKGGPFIREHK